LLHNVEKSVWNAVVNAAAVREKAAEDDSLNGCNASLQCLTLSLPAGVADMISEA